VKHFLGPPSAPWSLARVERPPNLYPSSPAGVSRETFLGLPARGHATSALAAQRVFHVKQWGTPDHHRERSWRSWLTYSCPSSRLENVSRETLGSGPRWPRFTPEGQSRSRGWSSEVGGCALGWWLRNPAVILPVSRETTGLLSPEPPKPCPLSNSAQVHGAAHRARLIQTRSGASADNESCHFGS